MDFDKCHLCRSENPPYERDAATFDLKTSCIQTRFTGSIIVGLNTPTPRGSDKTSVEWERVGEIKLLKTSKVCQS